ncbi:chorismate mutase [Fodinicola feengrottensis]|uniref:chorismate mutase n=1 Tax=Fodinicola feengrottensis TaxID=435914 RepID=UPI0024418A42|nr:chorismate mutase [Fodinicola feengrottensis]
MTTQPTTTATPDDQIGEWRVRIDEIDAAIIELWNERSRISGEVGKARRAAGGPRLVLSREQRILERYRRGLGAIGVRVAMLVLESGRGPL